jgi:pimeloyl-ACP methyl ester carboxylesterase
LLTGELWHHQIADLSDIANPMVADHTVRDDIVESARFILETAPAKFALAGLSFGGYLAMEIMRQAAGRVERLALLDTTARPDSPDQAKRRRDFIALADRGRFLGVTEDLIKTFVHPDRHDDGDFMALIKRMAQDVGPKAFVRQERAILSRPDSLEGLSAIKCPALVLCGRQDALTPVDRHTEMAERIEGSKLVIIEDCGHLPPLEKPDEVTDALRAWLTA